MTTLFIILCIFIHNYSSSKNGCETTASKFLTRCLHTAVSSNFCTFDFQLDFPGQNSIRSWLISEGKSCSPPITF